MPLVALAAVVATPAGDIFSEGINMIATAFPYFIVGSVVGGLVYLFRAR